METRICCAYNLSRGCPVSSRVTVAHSAQQPLKVLKVLLNELALDSESSLWLTHLTKAPQMMRLFPFDFVYLDGDLRIIEGVELLPEVPFPGFRREVVSALILPLYTLASTGTGRDDQLLICTSEELELRLAEISAQHHLAPVAASPAETAGEIRIPLIPHPAQGPRPFTSPRIPLPIHSSTVMPGTGFTVSLTASWQISSSTMSAVLPEVEAGEEVAATGNAALLDAEEAVVPEARVAEPEPAEAREEQADDPACEPTPVVEVAASVEEDLSPATATAPEELRGDVAAETNVQTVALEATADVVSDPALETAAPEAAEEAVAVEAIPEAAVREATDEAVAAEAAPEAVTVEPTSVPVTSSIEADRPSESIPLIPDAALKTVESVEPATTKTPASNEWPAAGKQHANSLVQKAPAIAPPSAPSTPRTESHDKKKDPLGTRVIRWLNLEDPPPERRSIIRLLLQGLQAYDTDGDGSKRYDVRDVCPPGFYLRTREQWRAGQVVSLVLEKKGATGPDHERRVTVQARVVRCDEDGFGLEFVFPEGTEFHPWQRVKTKRSDETEADFILKELRLARALGFLQRLCPGVAPEIKHALHDRLSNKRVASAVEIALKAESSLARNRNAGTAFVHPDVLMRIIEGGSWIEDDWIRGMWAGILVSSCGADGQDTSNLAFLDLLAKLNRIHLRVLTLVCRKGVEAMAPGQSAAKLDLDCTADELMEAADSHSFARIQQTIGHLSTFGLIAEAARPSYVMLTGKEKTRTVPTNLGLKMYARCNGQR